MFPSRRLLPIAALLLSGTRAFAGDVVAEHPWSRATPPGASTGAVYVTLLSKDGDRLVGATSPAATGASVHDMTMDGNIMRMREVVGGLTLPPGKPVALQPGGYHIMLTGLKAPLKRGETVPLHLTFANAPPLDIAAPIAGIGASSASGSTPSPAMPGMKH